MAGGSGASGGRGRRGGRGRGRRGRRGGRGGNAAIPPSPPSSSDVESIDLTGFEFYVLIHMGMNSDRLLLPRKFAQVIDGQEPHAVTLRVPGCTTGHWPVDVTFDRVGQMYLDNGWREFAEAHGLAVGHFVVFLYDGRSTFTVTVFDDTCCRRRYQTDSEDDSDGGDDGDDE